MDLVTNAKHVVSSVQDVAQRLSEYAKFKEQRQYPEIPVKEEVSAAPSISTMPCELGASSGNSVCKISDELFVPGTLYYVKRNVDGTKSENPMEYFTLLRRHASEHSQRILLSSNIISDHKCDSHYEALRDVLKDEGHLTSQRCCFST